MLDHVLLEPDAPISLLLIWPDKAVPVVLMVPPRQHPLHYLEFPLKNDEGVRARVTFTEDHLVAEVGLLGEVVGQTGQLVGRPVLESRQLL